MGQYWNIINIDKKKGTGDLGKLGVFFNDEETNHWVGSLLRPLRALPPMPWLSPDNGGYCASPPANCAPLLRLPPELLYIIGKHLECVEDRISFAATCHVLWAALAPILAPWFEHATWAGCRIMCLGDYMRDLPSDTLLSHIEHAELVQCGTQHDHSTEHGHSPEGEPQPARLFDYAYQHYGRARDNRKELGYTGTWRLDLQGAPHAALRQVLLVYPLRSGKPLVLRNLSKKVYVRSGAVDVLNKQLFAQDAEAGIANKEQGVGYCLGDALVCRICWSSDPSCAMWEPPEDLTRGPWAGDRFDVITQDEFGEKEDYDEWEDASREVCEVLRQCWRK
ncbi:hypothetical protein CALVIDRAFT_487445 [Calocera viscosa TUFC12733]|uniref:F-box domain-containing protein n=1 Tax=Calocera viscosa (strain TUFC12733) TaxID=1330018 RepID=A0A167IA56_CALVF|nr:hypothetical protein CALVIDRAFT_487445 [Calocera viscosa TUFC12733]